MLAEHLRRAAPDSLVEVVDRHVRAELGGLRADALVADYRITGLWPVLRPDDPTAGLLAERTAAARCFGSQDPFVEDVPQTPGVRLYVPLTVWGERIGVLVVDFPTTPKPATVRRTCAAAEELAVALRAADRETDRYRLARRRERLSMAAEMQWDLLPGRVRGTPRLHPRRAARTGVHGRRRQLRLGGQRRPADVTVLNGYGAGLAASALTGLAVNAMRNARRSGGSLVEQAELARETVFYAAHRGAGPIETLLLELDARTGAVTGVDAGSPLLWRVRGRHGRAGHAGAPAAAGHVRGDPVRHAGVSARAGRPVVPGQRRRVRGRPRAGARRTGSGRWRARSGRPGCSRPPRRSVR